MEWDTLAILAAMTVAAIWAGHWFPWSKLLRRDEGLPRLAAYTIGVLSIAGPLTVWLLRRDMAAATVALWVAIVSAGAATVVAWVVDALLASRDVLEVLSEPSDER